MAIRFWPCGSPVSICLAIVLFAGVYIFAFASRSSIAIRRSRWAARILRLWKVILVWLLAVDLLVTMLWRL
jgi:hypothetical protein